MDRPTSSSPRARERAGDFIEAERTYDVAIEHIPGFVPAFRARAALLRRMGQLAREMADLEHLARVAEGPDTLRALAARYVEDSSMARGARYISEAANIGGAQWRRAARP